MRHTTLGIVVAFWVAAVLPPLAPAWGQVAEPANGSAPTPATAAGKPAKEQPKLPPTALQESERGSRQRVRVYEDMPVYIEDLTVGTITVTKGILGYTAAVTPRPLRRGRPRAKITVRRPTIVETKKAIVEAIADAKLASKEELAAVVGEAMADTERRLDERIAKEGEKTRQVVLTEEKKTREMVKKVNGTIFPIFATISLGLIVSLYLAAALRRN